jgi:hypothetical protein
MVPYDACVARTVDQVLKEVREWPLEEQEKLALELVSSLEESGDDLTDEWKEEVGDRLDEIDRGDVELRDGETVLRELKARRTSRR